MAVAETPPGQKVKIKAVRHGQEKDFEVVVAESKAFEDRGKSRNILDDKEEKPKAEIGLEVNDVPVRIAKELQLSGGAFVDTVKPGSLADDAGLNADADVIVAANGKAINNKEDMSTLVKSLKSGDPIVLKIIHVTRDENNRLQTETGYTSIIRP